MARSDIDGKAIETWRTHQGLSQRDVAGMFDVSDSSVVRWEKGQEIPGPVKMLFALLIHGAPPFQSATDTEAASADAKHLGRLKLSLTDWDALEERRIKEGFPSVRDLLLSIIQAKLAEWRAAEK